MLRAAVGSPDVAVAAWQQWRSDRVVYDADSEEARLLAPIAARIGRLLPDDPELQRLNGHRRHSWTINTLRVARSGDVAASLRAAGIDSLFFKGLGMLPHYRELSMRNMNDADLLVRWHQRHEAIDHLVGIGFEPVYGISARAMHRMDQIYPGFGMRRADGIEVDLHWRPLHHLRRRPHLDEPLFEHSRFEQVGHTPVAVPDPSHHFVLVVGHGMRSDSAAHLIAVVDACQLLAAVDFDPERAAELARRYERTSAVRDVCRIIDDVLADGAADDLVDVRRRASTLRRSLTRRSIGDRLLDRQLHTPPSPPNNRPKVVRDIWVAASDTSIRRGGPLTGLADLARREMELGRSRDVPAQLTWIMGGRTQSLQRFRRTTTRVPRPPSLRIGESLTVAASDGFESLLASGWWELESHHVWSHAPEAALCCMIDLEPGRSCNLAITSVPFLTETNPDLTVDVRVNGRTLAIWRYHLDTDVEITQRITLSATDLVDGRCDVVFVIDGGSSPLATGVSEDVRVLGMALQSVAIEPIGILSPGGHVAPRTSVREPRVDDAIDDDQRDDGQSDDARECGDATDRATGDGLRARRVRRAPRDFLGRRHRGHRRATPPPVR